MYDYRRRSREEKQRIVDERIARGYPAHQPPHTIRDGHLYLLTAACYEHRPHIHSAERRQTVLDLLRGQCDKQGILIHAWVILATHYHTLAELTDLTVLGDIFRRVHGRTSHDWNAEERTQGRRVWYQYTDRAIRSERHYYTTLNYLHYNPKSIARSLLRMTGNGAVSTSTLGSTVETGCAICGSITPCWSMARRGMRHRSQSRS